MLLKSLTIAIPKPASEYNTVNTTTGGVNSPPAAPSPTWPNMAWPHHHGRAM
jgi:hypothetical protein